MTDHDDPTRFGRWKQSDVRAAVERDRCVRVLSAVAIVIVMLGLAAMLVWSLR
jgi:hypothetical protein